MAQTIVEKIISNNVGYQVRVGNYVLVEPDIIMAHDTTCAWALSPFKKIAKRVAVRDKIVIVFDHAYPSPNVQAANLQSEIREFAREQNIPIITDGICHQILVERYVRPGCFVLGADSHTPTSGALGAVAVGVGSSDIAIAMATGKCWIRVPQTIKINITGKRRKNIFAKDVILSIARLLKSDGANHRAIEFVGPIVEKMDVAERLTLTNMAAELGAKCAIVASDAQTEAYLNNQGRGADYSLIKSDTDAFYERVIDFDVSEMVPQVAIPHQVDTVVDVQEIAQQRIKVDQVFIGSCTNGRIEDLEVAYKILHTNKLADNIRLIITPASNAVYCEALRRGYLQSFMELGAIVTSPGCGACLGRHGGILADGEVCVATSNRNFQGRMGSAKASVYLVSPEIAAKIALTGYITDTLL